MTVFEWFNQPIPEDIQAKVDLIVAFVEAEALEKSVKTTGELGECCSLFDLREDYCDVKL